jgi:NADH dehydrogenase
MAQRNVLVLGGTGFVGSYVVARLAAASHRVVVVTRRRESARHLILLPTVQVVESDPYDATALGRLAQGMDTAINLVGIINEGGGSKFSRAHVDIVRTLTGVCKSAGVTRLLHMSARNADPSGPSKYLRTKGEAEAIVAGSGLAWTIFRPSVIFGREDSFLNKFARMLKMFPVMPLPGANAKFQPIYVGDVAHCFSSAIDDDLAVDQRFDLCGPRAYTLIEIVRYVGEVSGNPRPIIALGPTMSKLQATLGELVPGKPISRDNLASMSRDSVCDGPLPALFGIQATALEAVAPSYLAPDALHSHFDEFRAHSGR